MNKGEFNAGIAVGMIILALSQAFVWHLHESVCQQENNVADCVLASPAFVPASEESK